MTSERIRRRIESLLDEAEAASSSGDWRAVAEKSRAILAIEEGNEDARAFLKMAAANGGGGEASPAPAAASTTGASTEALVRPTTPESFAGGRYHVRRFLGEGGKKKVFLAHDESLDREVAFALIKTEGLDAIGRERVTREAQAMGRLGAHPHVVTIFEIGEEAGAPYVVTELMGGGDVEGLLEKAGGPLALDRSLALAKDICEGLVFAHAQGIVHRDLKPGNVWLTASGVAKIGDFGLAVNLSRSRLTQHGLMVGTVAYMPPEQALGGEVTPQSDLYSLGAMLYELVTGRPPFQADDPTAVISQHINTPPVAPSWNSDHCPPDLEALILRLLAKVPGDRPASAADVLQELERVDPNARSASHSDSQVNPLDRLARGVFVGRERELERLRGAFDDAFAGRGSVVMLVGEPGIGKTRTVQELETYARMRGAKVFWGRAHEASGAPPYWPWIQIGRAYRDQTAEDIRRVEWQPYAVELQRIFPGLRELFPDLPEPPPADSEEAQFALFDAWSSFIRNVAVRQPVVVVLDDVHWADRPTLRMLTHLARDIDRARLLVLGTYRDTDLDRTHPLSEALTEMNREDLFSRVLLRGLSEAETAAYVQGVANVQPPPELVRRIHVETEGNPFFLAEVVNLMTEEGTLASDSLSEIRIPQGVREALGRRLDRLSPEANELLSTAAVIGREFTHALLLALTSLDDDALLRLVEEALRARVIEETNIPGEYRFTHALMQDALYAELSTARRVRMHGRVAETLEVMYGENSAGRAAELARHFGEAAVMNHSLASKAVLFSELAAEQAREVAAWDDAVRWYREAIAGAESANVPADARIGDLWMCLSGSLLYLSGTRAEAFSAFHEGVKAYRIQSDPRALAAGIALWRTGRASGPISDRDLVPLRPLFQEALAPLGDEPSSEACLMLTLLAVSDRSSAGDRYAQRARAMADQLGVKPYERLDLREVVRLMDRGHYEQAAEEGLRLYEQLAVEPRSASRASGLLPRSTAFLALFSMGALDRAAELAFKHLAQNLERRVSGLTSRLVLAVVGLGRNDKAHFTTLMTEASRNLWASVVAANDAIVRGDLAHAGQLLPTRDHPDWSAANRAEALALELRLRVIEGDTSNADRAFREWRAAAEPSALPGPSDVINALVEAGDGLLALGNESELRSAYATLAEHSAFRLARFAIDSADVMRGALAIRLGDIEAAEQHYTEGLEWARRPDVRFGFVEGRCLQGLAVVAEARGDETRAMEYLDAAGEKFAEYGAKLYLDQVLAKKQFLKA